MAKNYSIKRRATEKDKPGSGGFFSKNTFLLACILVVTAVLFLPALTRHFVLLDDTIYVADNPVIKSFSVTNLKSIFFSFHNANYHPLTMLSYAIEYRLFGQDARAYHVVNLLIHLLNVLLVFMLVQKITGRKEAAGFAALLFGIHPLHVESVAWISERKDLLYSFFYIAGLYAYIQYATSLARKNRLYLFAFSLFLLSLLSKPAAVTFPLVLLLLDYYYRRGMSKKVVIEKIPFFVFSLLFGVVAILAQQSQGALDNHLMPDYTIVQRFFVVCYSVSWYIVKLFLPFHLSALHYAPEKLSVYFYLSPVFLLLISLLIYKTKTMRRELIFGLLFYLASISLTVNILPIGYAVVSERYSYIPYIGLFLVLGVFYTYIRDGKFTFPSPVKSILAYICILFCVFCMAITFQRVRVWKDSFTLFKDIVEKYPESAQAHFYFAMNAEDIRGDVNVAFDAYSKAIALDSAMEEPRYYRGIIQYDRKNYEAALADFHKAAKLKPRHVDAYYNAGITYEAMNRYEDAVKSYTKGIKVLPHSHFYQARARAYAKQSNYRLAFDDCNQALKLNPDNPEVIYNRGLAAHFLGRKTEACADWKKVSAMGYKQAGEMMRQYCK